FPDLAETGTFRVGAIEDVVAEFDDDAFDVVYSVETLQHLHPDAEWVFDELARVAGALLVTVENEGDGDDGSGVEGESAKTTGGDPADGPAVNYVDGEVPLYYRDWNDVFTGVGLAEVESRSLDRDTFRAFVPK
ncbi:methyltransferase, partial [Halogeometricum pallidum JCM 14848]